MHVRSSILTLGCIGALVAACGGEEITTPPPTTNDTAKFSTRDKITAHLDGKTMTMSGTNIPSHPNGFDENTNFGANSQCYQNVVMTQQAGRIHVVSNLGTVEGAAAVGMVGTCNKDVFSAKLEFDSTAVLIENVKDNGGCFDFNITYAGFSQEGRGSISADGNTLVLELFFGGRAAGHRCADGAVGAATVTLMGAPFTGDARQTYVISQ